MKSPVSSFEIKIAILGHVSAGKTTLLNALLGNKFSGVSKKKETAGITHFSLNFTQNEESSDEEVSISDGITDEQKTSPPANKKRSSTSIATATSSNSKRRKTSDLNNKDFLSSQDTLKRITDTNRRLREEKKLEEETLEIQITGKPLVEMRPDTQLVITDIPGVNEAGTSEMYLNWVKEAWDTFDCMLVVMDTDQGVNTDQPAHLLEFVHENKKTRKDIPVIILCNKVDEPDDSEMKGLVGDIRGAVEDIFDVKVPDLSSLCNLDPQVPVFLHLSAENAYLYRVASGIDRSCFEELGIDIIDKIGRQENSKYEWVTKNQKQKYDAVYEVVSDETQYKERMCASNFDKLMKVLEKLLGGPERQAVIIEKQMSVQLSKLTADLSFVGTLLGIISRASILGKPINHLMGEFWEKYSQLEKTAFEAFEEDPSKLQLLYGPFHALEALERYVTELVKSKTTTESDCELMNTEKILSAMKRLVQKFCEIIKLKIESAKYDISNFNDPWKYKNKHLTISEPECHVYQSGWFNTETKEFLSGFKANDPRPEETDPDKYHSHFEWNESKHVWESNCTKKTFPGLDKNQHPLDSHLIDAWNSAGWDRIYFQDWNMILESILMLQHSRHFVENFSTEIAELKLQLSIHSSRISLYNSLRVLNVPSSPEDKSHWGHLPWMFCDWAERKALEESNDL